MATGRTITGSLADSLPTVVAAARNTRAYGAKMTQLADKHTLDKNTGLDWKEILLAKMTAQVIQETTVLNNPQQHSDTAITVTPTFIGIETFVSHRTKDRISKLTLARMGSVPQAAMEIKKNADGLTQLDSFSNSHCGAGNTLTSGHISAAVSLITGNTTEPGPFPIRCVLHPHQIKDLEDELVAGVGTYILTEGRTAQVFAEGFRGKIAGAEIYEDGNISIDSSTDAKGGVFSKMAIVLVQGAAPKIYTKFRPEIGAGGDSLYHYDEYAWGERLDTWGVEIYSDATQSTS